MQGQFSLKCLDQRLKNALILDKQKTLVGSDAKCDLVLTDPSVSSLHAFISLIGSEGILVKDLGSDAGVFVNGNRVAEASLFPGDILTIGTLSFAIESLQDDVPVFKAPEKTNTKFVLPKPQAHIELPQKPGLVFIDGEYCDISFDDSDFIPLKKLQEVNFSGDFVDLDQTQETLDIVHETKGKKLEIISYVNGKMLDVQYVQPGHGDYYLSPDKKSKNEIQFHTIKRTKIFGVQNGELRFYPTDAVVPSIDWEKITLKEALFLTHGTEQLSLRLVSKTNNWRAIPLFYRDREFFEQGLKVFAGVFLPMLLLLFVTLPKPQEVVEEKAIVYTIKAPKPPEVKPIETPKAEEKSEVATMDPVKTEEMAHKETEQPVTKTPEFAEANGEKKVVAKAQTPDPVKTAPMRPTPKAKPVATSNPIPAPSKPVAASAVAKATPTPAPAPVKAYEFKSSIAMNSLVGTAPKINTQGGGSASSASNGVKGSTFNAGNSDSGELVTGSNVGVGKFNGADSRGSGQNSYGSKGLASKKGFDSSYLEPRTEVLGSMDPELLRKILREYIPQFRHCYQQELIGKSDKVKGIIDLQFTISAQGRVSKYNVKVKDAQFSDKGRGCMGQVLSIIDFPKPKGGGHVDVRQPLNFFAETEKI
ncbi:MAG TPA: FHA domain-containing protein [Bacteriovoracaceae bacterium]|nr:FHA domain-containing protein [Bacteriovoracaceae bacterium]